MPSPLSLVLNLKGDVSGLTSSLGGATSVLNSFATSATKKLGEVESSMGKMAIGGGAIAGGVVIAGAAIGAALYKVAADFDRAYDRIQQNTGASGKRMEELKQSFNSVFQETHGSMESTADVITVITQRVQGTTPQIEALSTEILNLAKITGIDAKQAADDFTRAMGAWQIPANEATVSLDKLFVVHQKTGIAMDDLIQKVFQFQAPFQGLGFSFEETAALMGTWTQQGVNMETVLTRMTFANKALNAPTNQLLDALRPFPDVFAKIESSTTPIPEKFAAVRKTVEDLFATGNLEDRAKAVDILVGTFGARGITEMIDLFEHGRWNIDQIMSDMAKKGTGDLIDRQEKATEDFAEKWDRLVRHLEVFILPAATKVFDELGDLVDKFFGKMPKPAKVDQFGNVIEGKPGEIGKPPAKPKPEGDGGWLKQFTDWWDDNGTTVMNVLTLGTGGIQNVGPTFVDWGQKAKTAWDWLGDPTKFDTATDAVKGFVSGLFDPSWFTTARENLQSFFGEVPGMILTFFTGPEQWLVQQGWAIIQGLWDGAMGALGPFLGWVGGIAGAVWTWIGDALSWLWQKGVDIIQGLWNGAVAWIGGFLGWVAGIGGAVVAWVGDALSWLWQKGVDLIQGLWNGAVAKIGEFASWVGNLGGDIFNWLAGGIGGVLQGFADIGSSIIQAIVEGIKAAAGNVWSALKGALGGTIRSVPVVGGPVADALGLQHGGIVPGRGRGDVVPAMLEPGELVIPKDKVAQLGSAGGIPDPAALQAVADASTAVLTDYTDTVITAVQDSATSVLASQTETNATMVAATQTTQDTMGQSVTLGMAAMLATTQTQYTAMNAETGAQLTLMNAQVGGQLTALNLQTGQQYALLHGQTQLTMLAVNQTMTAGAAGAADHFVAEFAARIPPLNFTLAGYSNSVLTYGRQFMDTIGAPHAWREGGIDQAQIAPDGAWRVWAEKGTGGEAYIPRKGANDPMGVLSTAAGWYGATVVPYQAGGLSLAELFWEAGSGTDWKNGVDIGRTIGGHADHVHAGSDPAHVWEDIQNYLAGVGIIGRPTSTTGGSHAAGSLHYQHRAVDYGNSVNDCQAIYNALVGLAGGVGAASLPVPVVPPVPDFGPGIPAEQAKTMAGVMAITMQNLLNQAVAARAAAAGGGPAPPGALSDWINAALGIAGKPASWAAGIYPRAMQESGGNPRAVNNWDSNARAGTPSKGIMQMIDSTFAAYMVAGHGDIWNPIDNIAAAANYIAARYGDPYHLPSGGYRFGGVYGGSIADLIADTGTVLTPGWNMRYNGTGANESLTPGGGVNVQVTVEGNIYGDEHFKRSVEDVYDELGRQLERALVREGI